MKIIFVIGGARSGKSSFAMREASKVSGKKAFIATAEARDDEMTERITRHRKQRGTDWHTYEEAIGIAETLKEVVCVHDVVVLDCLTMWLSNLMCAGRECSGEIDHFIHEIRNTELSTLNSRLFIVSNEVGMGIVPESELSRRFRDMAGILNQKAAELSDEVYLVTAGIPVRIK